LDFERISGQQARREVVRPPRGMIGWGEGCRSGSQAKIQGPDASSPYDGVPSRKVKFPIFCTVMRNFILALGYWDLIYKLELT